MKINGVELNVTVVNITTKKAEGILHRYWKAKVSDVRDAYVKPSAEKVSTFKWILEEMESVGGHKMRITGAGSSFYSCAYEVESNGHIYLIYHTHMNRYLIQIA